MSLFENVRKTIDGLGQIELSGIKLETARAELLDVGQLDLDKHVAMQPAAIAYYGAMKKEASRRLGMLRRAFDRWKDKKWALAKAAVSSGTTQSYKPTLADIESRFITDNERELEDWDAKLDKAQEEADTLESWYEAWRQKSFSLREHVSIDEDERWSGSGSMKGGEPSGEVARVREIMRRRKERGGQQASQ
jgi:hypothetical protein